MRCMGVRLLPSVADSLLIGSKQLSEGAADRRQLPRGTGSSDWLAQGSLFPEKAACLNDLRRRVTHDGENS